VATDILGKSGRDMLAALVAGQEDAEAMAELARQAAEEVFYHLLKDKRLEYHELGANYFDTLDPIRLRRHLVKRLESLGYEVTLAERSAA